MTPDFSHIEGVIWDLDGTLYRYDAIFREACNIAAARTAIDLGLTMSFEDALALTTESENTHGNSFKLLAAHGIKYEDFHQPFHRSVDTTILAKNHEMRDALGALDLKMVILTNASRPWALKTLEHLEIRGIFGDDHILALEDVNFQSKGQSRAGFEKGLSLMNLKPQQTLMVEDMTHNLVIAKQMGMTTVLVHHGQMPEDCDHVDYLFQDTLELVKALAA